MRSIETRAAIPAFVLTAFFFGQSVISGQGIPGEVLQNAWDRYTRVVALGADEESKMASGKASTSSATGFRIGGNYVITNFHTLIVDHDWTIDGRETTIVKVDTLHDLVLARVDFPKEVPWIKLADATVGTYVWAVSNAGSENGFVVHHFVSKRDEKYLYLQEPSIPGDSGGGLLDKDNHLVGLFMENSSGNNGGGVEVSYSRAIPASVLKKFLHGIMPE